MVEQLVHQLVHYNAIEQVMIVLEAVENFVPIRARIIRQMRVLASELDEHNFNGNIAKVVGSGAGTAAGVTTFTMLLAAPFTAGISLVVGAGVMGGIAAAGTATQLGTKAVIWKLSRDTKKAVDELLEQDERAYEPVRRAWKELDVICTRVQRMQEKWTWNEIVNTAFWVAEKIIEFIVPIGLGRLGKKAATLTKTLFSIHTNEYFKTQIARPFLRGDYRLLFHNAVQFVRNMIDADEFWIQFLQIFDMVGAAAIVAISTLAGGIFISTAGYLTTFNMSTLIDTIINMAKGSPSETAIAICKKANELEEQKVELERFVKSVRNAISR